ncbi:hypothetical protein D3C87_2039860 [compost metagenome]
MEQNPFMLSFMVRKERAQPILKELMNRYSIRDVTVEEEDIGNVVERIYNDRGRPCI